jgi:RNA recognition motif-containing protein
VCAAIETQSAAPPGRAFLTGDPVEKTLYVGNLASHQDAVAVERLFSCCGKVLHLKVMAHDDIFRHHAGFAIVEMESEHDAIGAIRTLNGSEFHGNTLTVRAATALEETAAGHPRIFGTMNMADEPQPPPNV